MASMLGAALLLMLLLATAYGRECMQQLHWAFAAAGAGAGSPRLYGLPTGPVAAPGAPPRPSPAPSAPREPARLLDRLVADLSSDDESRVHRAETLLANYPGPDLIRRLLPLLEENPWHEGAASAARLLLLQGDDSVIDPLHRFFSLRDGGLAAFLEGLDAARPATPEGARALEEALVPEGGFEAPNVVSLWGDHRGQGRRRR